MSTPSASEERPAPDQSLTRPIERKGLTYPLGERAPASGELIDIAPGVGWARLPVPGSLRHINVWALDDRDDAGEGVALVDTGLSLDVARAGWDALFEGPLAGRRVTRVIVTHFHPDHVGLAGWLCRRFDAPLWMTRTEWLMARMLAADIRDAVPEEDIAAKRLAGWDEPRLDAHLAQGWGRFSRMVTPLPLAFVRLVEGDVIVTADRHWRVMIGSGHTPEHACLVDEDAGVVIAGDQILPRISSNVSLGVGEPMGDPLGDWLGSIDRFAGLPADMLVLPAHGEPFTGLRTRLAALKDDHLERLEELHTLLSAPRRAVDCFTTLFSRPIDDSVYGLATGEAMAHLRHLEVDGRARRRVQDGVAWFEAT